MTHTTMAASLGTAPPVHKPRPYPPSPWGDYFLGHQPRAPAELLAMEEKARAKEEEVRRIVLAAAASPDLAAKLELVDALQRIGVAYRFDKEIGDLLRAVHGAAGNDEDDNLYLTSLRFYLLRKHGCQATSGKNIMEIKTHYGSNLNPW